MNKTKIEYLDYTWNPIAMRCTPVSDGCRNCWHLAMAKRLAGNPSICLDERLAYGSGAPLLKHRELEAPLHLKKPAWIGVQFMGDLFHGSLSCDMIRDVLWKIQRCGWHTFLILTKRPIRMREFLEGAPILENLWFGVSVEDQKTADERIPILLQIPAAHRWISVEPMLSRINLDPLVCRWGASEKEDVRIGGRHEWPYLHWVVLGGETGPKTRPAHPDWVRSLRDQCQEAGVPFFFKGWGKFQDAKHDCMYWEKVGRLLDGREWKEIP